MAAIVEHFGVHYSTVSRAVKEQEKTNEKCVNARPDPQSLPNLDQSHDPQSQI